MIIKPGVVQHTAFGTTSREAFIMLATIVIGMILFIVALIIYIEYRNEKKYRQERQKRDRAKHQKKKPEPKISKRPTAEKPSVTEPKHTNKPPKTTQPTPKTPVSPQAPATPKEETKQVQETPKATPVPKPEPKKQPATELPEGNYPDFNYDRLIEMGLSEEEAHEFIQELIPQIGDQIPLIDEAMKIPDFHKMERLTHSIKGSSTTIGTGGVSDLLVEYNTYLKTGNELPVAEAYQEHLKRYFEKLKKQFPPKA